MVTAPREKALKAVRAGGLIRPRDLAAAGVPTWVLYELVREGAVKQVSRGLYCIPG